MMPQKRKYTRKYFAPQNEGEDHVCDFPGCAQKGLYRAPKNKSLKEYFWFCLKHVQEYNARWNYYETGDFAEETQKKRMHFGGFRSKIKYQFGYDFMDELGIDDLQNESAWKQEAYFNSHDRKCAEIMDIDLDRLTLEALKKQYKKLARQYHPDLHAGDKEYEEKFKRITAAYKDLCLKLKDKLPEK